MSKNYMSPYSKSVNLYPSQLEEYISLDMGGRTNARDTQHTSSTKYQRRPNIGSHQKKQWTPRKNEDYKNKGIKSENSSISSYLHPSMTEDPWLGMMKRIDAIEKSRISLGTESDRNNSSEPMIIATPKKGIDPHSV